MSHFIDIHLQRLIECNNKISLITTTTKDLNDEFKNNGLRVTIEDSKALSKLSADFIEISKSLAHTLSALAGDGYIITTKVKKPDETSEPSLPSFISDEEKEYYDKLSAENFPEQLDVYFMHTLTIFKNLKLTYDLLSNLPTNDIESVLNRTLLNDTYLKAFNSHAKFLFYMCLAANEQGYKLLLDAAKE